MTIWIGGNSSLVKAQERRTVSKLCSQGSDTRRSTNDNLYSRTFLKKRHQLHRPCSNHPYYTPGGGKSQELIPLCKGGNGAQSEESDSRPDSGCWPCCGRREQTGERDGSVHLGKCHMSRKCEPVKRQKVRTSWLRNRTHGQAEQGACFVLSCFKPLMTMAVTCLPSLACSPSSLAKEGKQVKLKKNKKKIGCPITKLLPLLKELVNTGVPGLRYLPLLHH